MPRLVLLTEGFTGRSFELKAERSTVGRLEDNNFQIPAPSVSSHHCEILLKGNDVTVKDLDSTNGTFINGELGGRAADPTLPWAMVFPQSGSSLARHPSQLYQFALEGLLLFVLLWIYARRPRATGQVSGAFLFGYGVLRFAAEYFREPDSFLGPLALGLSMGQWLCVPMIAAGAALWWWAGRQRSGLPARATL